MQWTPADGAADAERCQKIVADFLNVIKITEYGCCD